MHRPTTLLVLFVALAVVVVWTLGRDGTDEGGTAVSGDATEEAPEVPDATRTDLDRVPAPTHADRWDVVVVDFEGRPLPDARLVAVRPGGRLEGTGDTSWERPLAGAWTLVVTAQGLPVERREVDLPAGERTRTLVQLSEGVRVRGVVRDARNRPRGSHIVGFVPDGARAPERPALWLRLPHTRSRSDGTFETILPAEGAWRLFVGYGGRIQLEDEHPVTFGPDGPTAVDVVVPARTRLVARVSDAPGVERTAGFGFTVYRSAAILDVERPIPPRPAVTEPEEPPDPSDPDAVAEYEAVKRHLEEVEAANADPEAVRRRELRMAVVPEGWRKAKSGFCNVDGRLVFEALPAHEELRFAVSRGQEAFRVEGATTLRPGDEVHVHLELPAPLPEDAPPLLEPRAVVPRFEVVEPEGELLEVGTTWR